MPYFSIFLTKKRDHLPENGGGLHWVAKGATHFLNHQGDTKHPASTLRRCLPTGQAGLTTGDRYGT
jgi:hypothetical protein